MLGTRMHCVYSGQFLLVVLVYLQHFGLTLCVSPPPNTPQHVRRVVFVVLRRPPVPVLPVPVIRVNGTSDDQGEWATATKKKKQPQPQQQQQHRGGGGYGNGPGGYANGRGVDDRRGGRGGISEKTRGVSFFFLRCASVAVFSCCAAQRPWLLCCSLLSLARTHLYVCLLT